MRQFQRGLGQIVQEKIFGLVQVEDRREDLERLLQFPLEHVALPQHLHQLAVVGGALLGDLQLVRQQPEILQLQRDFEQRLERAHVVGIDLQGHLDAVHGLLGIAPAAADDGRVQVRFAGVVQHFQLETQLGQLQVDVGIVLGQVGQLLVCFVSAGEIVAHQVGPGDFRVVLLGLRDHAFLDEQVGQDLEVLHVPVVGHHDLAVDRDGPAVETVVDVLLGDPLEEVGRVGGPLQAQVEIPDGVEQAEIVRFLLQDLLVLLDRVFQLALGNELLRVLQEFLFVEGGHLCLSLVQQPK